MATLHKKPNTFFCAIKGAPEVVLDMCTFYIENGKEKKLDIKQKKLFEKQIEDGAKKGYRTLGLAYKNQKESSIQGTEIQEAVFAGFVFISDPIRSEVEQTIKVAKRAGIHVVMITGDHANTAEAIGNRLGLSGKNKLICTGSDIDILSDDELAEKVKHVTVFARVEPIHKIRIVRAFQANDEVVAMTGDGINDAPAIKGADIGIALGSGTDVAKETSDMVLLDDSFTTIVLSVEEGRRIYQNIKKVVLYLLSGSFAEVVMITGSIVAGFPVAALPAQILWVNIIEDSFPNMALAFDKGDKENMQDPPRKKHEPLIDSEMKTMIILKSIFANVALFAIFVYFWKTTGDIKLTRTIVFVGFGIDALFYIFSIRSLRHMIWQYNPFSNLYLVGAVLLGWILLVSAIYVPILQVLLRTVPLEPYHWFVMIGFGLFNVVLIESIKFLFIIKYKKV